MTLELIKDSDDSDLPYTSTVIDPMRIEKYASKERLERRDVIFDELRKAKKDFWSSVGDTEAQLRAFEELTLARVALQNIGFLPETYEKIINKNNSTHK